MQTVKRENIQIRDPFVLTENGKYYLLGSSGDDPWGKGSTLELYESSDLENFKRVCVMVTGDYLNSYTNIWAPEVHKYNGKYYLIVSLYRKDLGRGSMIFVSDRLDSNFKPLTGEYVTPKNWTCLDATLFVYRSEPYLCFSNEWTNPVSDDGDGSLFIARLSKDLTRLEEVPKKIVSGKDFPFTIETQSSDAKGYVAEGPYLYEENGKIVLLWSGFTKTGYAVFKNVSENGVYGPYVYEKTLFDKDGGHCMRFTDLNGAPCITFHRPNCTPNERMQLFREND